MSGRIQRKTLAQLRTLLRHLRSNVRSHKPTAALWTNHVMAQMRQNQSVTDKQVARQLRRALADQVALVAAVQEEQELFRLYSGIDTDSPQYIAKSAHRVGLELPEQRD